MLTAIEGDILHWQCLVLDSYGDIRSCGEHQQSPLTEARYQGAARGAVIALPPCRCGAQVFLKADYTLNELWHEVQGVKNEQGVLWAYVLPLRYVRTLFVHHLLYTRGKADIAPIPPMPGQEVLALPHFAGVPPEVVYSLWFGFAVVQRREPALPMTFDVLSLQGGRA